MQSIYAAAPASDLAEILHSINTLRANFTQTIYDNHGKAVQQSTGRMALKRPGKFRWEVIAPIPQLIIANETRLWIYDKDLQQVTIRSLNKAAGETPVMLLSHANVMLDKDFSVKRETKKSSPWQWYKLTPHQHDSMFASIEMAFQGHEIHEMRLEDHLGHLTRIQFKNIEMNTALAASLFIFKVPAHVDVINEKAH